MTGHAQSTSLDYTSVTDVGHKFRRGFLTESLGYWEMFATLQQTGGIIPL